MAKKVLVTGSGGFIFSNFIRNAIYQKLPYVFISIDKVKQSSVLNNIYTNKNHTFYIGDCADDHFINVVFEYEKPDIVIHGAAESFVDDSLKEPNKFIHSNVLGTQVMVNAAVKWGVEKFIYISTDEVYGQLESAADPLWTEDAKLKPRNPYSASKAAGEFVVQAAASSYGLKYCITRSSNNYGPRQTPEKFIPKIIKCITENNKIPVYGQGMQIRDWLHVGDNCAAIVKIMESGEDKEIYNISSHQEFTNIEVVNEISKVMGHGLELVEFVKDRPGHDFRYGIDTTKIKKLGWEPNFKFKPGLAQTVQWYLNNNWFLKG